MRWAAHRALNWVESAALRLLFFGFPILGLFILASLISGPHDPLAWTVKH